MPANTTNFGLLQPLVNSSQDQDLWGNYLNANIGNEDSLLLTAMTNKTVPETASFSVTGRTNGTATTGNLRNLFLCDCTSAAIVATLPAADSVDNGYSVAFKKSDVSANGLTITPAGSDTIDGAASLVIAAQYQSFVVVSDGVSNWNILSGNKPKSLSINIQQFTSAGTYTPTAGMDFCIVEAVAGGGAGGGSNAESYGGGGAGGSGGYLKALYTAAQIGASQSVVVGAGAIGSSGNGGIGGTTSFGSLLSCTGGNGGVAAAGLNSLSTGGAGGVPTLTTGELILFLPGQAGACGYHTGSSIAGPGGSNPLGCGAAFNAIITNTHSPAFVATGFGSGGGGTLNLNDGTANNGASGGQGVITITEYVFA